jgi:transposase InsO family protein
MLRRRAVVLGRALGREGLSPERVATRLGLSAVTLRAWQRRWREDRLKPRPRGRPGQGLTPRGRREVRDLLELLGPLTGLASLQAAFPVERRLALAEALTDYRREVVSRDGYVVSMTRWLRPGVAWAMDFLNPPAPADGLHEKILAVRDLGSGAHLLWLAMPAESGEGVRAALQALIWSHGAPLVVKSDNGSVFLEESVRALLRKRGIVHLLSPPYYPRYNGACESGNGTLAAYTHHESAIHGRPGEWTSDDLEGARSRANEVVRSRGPRAPTAWERWRSRSRVGDPERVSFVERVARRSEEALAEVEEEVGAFVGLRDLATARRRAIEKACVEIGILEMRRRRICTPVSYKKLVRIW